MKLSTNIIIAVLAFMMSSLTLAKDQIAAQSLGQTLHDSKCQSCHSTSTYTREDRTIKSHEALKNRVNACMKPAKAEWNQSEMNAVVDYLEGHFYKF